MDKKHLRVLLILFLVLFGQGCSWSDLGKWVRLGPDALEEVLTGYVCGMPERMMVDGAPVAVLLRVAQIGRPCDAAATVRILAQHESTYHKALELEQGEQVELRATPRSLETSTSNLTASSGLVFEATHLKRP